MSAPAAAQSARITQPSADNRGLLAARLLPECLSLALALALATQVVPTWFSAAPQAVLQWVVMTEVATLMFLCTVVDIATRLRRAPPWWAGVLLCAFLLLMYPEVPRTVLAALQEGMWIALPFAWSILERLRELWTLPAQTKLEKLRRRALAFGRLYSGLVVAGLFTLLTVAGVMLHSGMEFVDNAVLGAGPWFIVLFFALSVVDTVRVHRPAFAARPRSLWRRIDGGQTAYLDPL